MEAWQIVLLVLLLTAFFYISVLLYVGSHAAQFRTSLKRRTSALDLICSEKKASLTDIVAICHRRNVVFSPSDEEAIAALAALSFDKPDAEKTRANIATLKSAQSHLAYLAQKNPGVKLTPGYAEDMQNIADLDRNLRQCSSLYNSDVVAFNYWLSIPLCRWLPFLMGCRKRNPIN